MDRQTHNCSTLKQWLSYTLSVVLTLQPALAYANPQGGSVSAGSATISSSGNTLTVNQQSNRAVINWTGFDIASGETTQFVQPASSSIALNRVYSTSASQIDGNLTANGNIILVNQNGVVFGAGSKVDVNSLVVSTANIDDNTFMNATGKFTFNQPGNPSASIVNNGQITAAQAGLVGFVAPSVINNGTITATLGRIQLASGDTATVDLYGDGLMEVAVSPAVASQLVSNTGTIQANGGKIQLSAAAGAAIVNSLITNTGTLQAQSVSAQNGKIIIASAGSQVGWGHQNRTGPSTVQIAGTVDVSGYNSGETGGKISILADNVSIQPGALIDASGNAAGGNVWIKAAQLSQQGTLLAQSLLGNGGTINLGFSTLYTDAPQSIVSAASASGTGGSIELNGGSNASLFASGAYIADGQTQGGSIGMMAGDYVWLQGAFLTASGSQGGGTISVGGNYNGTTGTSFANSTTIDGNSVILADATNTGNGGDITVTGYDIDFAGYASAQGGPMGGNGGSITLFAPGGNPVASNIAADKGLAPATSMDQFSGTLEASGYGPGGTGGTVQVLGDNVGLMSGALIDASGDAGGGYIKIGGDFHGQGTTPTALNTTVQDGATIDADAITSGNGGNVAVWADGYTQFAGTIYANGGAQSGNGGYVETSGHVTLNVGNDAKVNTLALNGNAGDWLLDPEDFVIASSGGDMTGATLSTNLGSGNVTILSSSGTTNPSGTGSIYVEDTVSWSANTLTLTAADNVVVSNTMTATGTAGLIINTATANGGESAVSGGSLSMAFASGVANGFAGQINMASGTSLAINGNSYTILTALGSAGSTTGTDIQGINGNLSGYYALGANINASATSGWNAGAGFTPIGNSSTPFTGNFEGLGHTISNLTSHQGSTNSIGPFGKVNNGSINDIGMVSESITGPGGGSSIGGLVGMVAGTGTVANSYSTGSVTGNNSVGGLVGENDDSSGTINIINNSYSTATVTCGGNLNCGGLVGDNIEGIVSNSYATGNVSGTPANGGDIGGLAGANSGTISNSYATGNVTTQLSAGFTYAGSEVGSNAGTLTNDTSSGNVTVSASGSISPASGDLGITAGSGAVTLSAGTDIVLTSDSITTQGGSITLDANTGGTGGAISLTSTTLTSSGGNITLGGGATPASIAAIGDATYNQGIYINGATVNAGGGTISMLGTGYSGSTGYNSHGNGILDTGAGILLNGATISTSGNGTMAFSGTGEGTGADNDGFVQYTAASTITGANGNISITGYGGTNASCSSNCIGIDIGYEGAVAAIRRFFGEMKRFPAVLPLNSFLTEPVFS